MPPTTEETAAALDKARQDLAAAEAAHQDAEKAAAGPRRPEVVLIDLLDKLVLRLGNRPDLRALVTEMQKAAVPDAEAPTS